MTQPASPSTDPIVVGTNARMKAVFDFIQIIAGGDSTVLITGESGTGKEVVATRIHQSSRRRRQPFVAVSCALFSEALIESELFGHERGAFTGAIKDRPGRFEMADGGTLFLDDIDDVPLGMQVKLLRVLQNRTVERVGGLRTIPMNVRVIAGSKRDLRQMAAERTFREDLYYRLNVVPIQLPPLRERREDIPILVQAFLERFFRRKGEAPPEISNVVMEAFTRYAWPGNVRELENTCERIAQTCACGTVRVGCVAANILFKSVPSPEPVMTQGPPATQPASPISLDQRLRELETSLITWALKQSHGNKSKAADLLQIKRSTLGDRIRLCGLDEKPVRQPDSSAAASARDARCSRPAPGATERS
jgi:DNA-binding NtrC family response regulator